MREANGGLKSDVLSPNASFQIKSPLLVFSDSRAAGATLKGSMNYEAINIKHKLSLFDELWSPRVIAEMNDYQFKLAKGEGEFVWHDHPDTDEVFIVIEGELEIAFRDGSVTLNPGEMFVIPKGVEHKPFAKGLVQVMLIESRGVVNTGETGGALTAENDIWV